ncbi:cysteine hydrolase [Amylibacter sp. SFDW26]|uniref:cysteine hydrolase family protein n=1 Tax=Amylibacter sp. SFDW26 TaxID=2652722 RepID=UPI0012617DF7|nr:cysteine hydrolase family protein [Amylibacter sp. SFDW26]KAB7615270.1 cysteine hydrolase [Amylibacter sp. SFDW26]
MKTALLVIDVQMGFVFRDAEGVSRSCSEAEQNIGALLSTFRGQGLPVFHIHNDDKAEASTFRFDKPGGAVQPFAQPIDGEPVIVKHVSSGFVGTTLEEDLKTAGIERLILCGAAANYCVETTARMAGNLGFDAYYVSDAVWAYESTGPDGVYHTAEQIHSTTLSNIHGEFATVVNSTDALCLIV